MKRLYRRRARGLSLVELVVGLAITALVLGALTPMLQGTGNAARITATHAALEQDASFAIARIAARIRITPSSQIGSNPEDWFKPAIYSLSNGVLLEKQGTKSYVLADAVTAFSIDVPAATESVTVVQVSLALARNGASASANATVRMGSAL